MTYFAAQLGLVAALACVVTWLLPKRQAAIWLAGFITIAAIADPRPAIISWPWVGLVLGLPVMAWTLGLRKRLEAVQ